SKGASDTVTRLINYFGEDQTAADNWAFMADNLTFIGDYFIHSTSTDPSLITGSLSLGSALSFTPQAVALTADDQAVVVTDESLIFLTSDDGTAGNRTFTLGGTPV